MFEEWFAGYFIVLILRKLVFWMNISHFPAAEILINIHIYIYIYIYSNCHEIRHLNVESMFKKEIPRKSSFISHFNLKYT